MAADIPTTGFPAPASFLWPRPRRWPSRQQLQNFGLHRSGHIGAALLHVYIHFAAHSELGQINSRFDRKTSARNDAPDVARLQPIHIRARAVNFLPDVVAGAVNEIFCNPALRITSRAARSTCQPSIARPAFTRSRTKSTAASRASRTMEKIFAYFSGTFAPRYPVHVMS